MQKKYLKGDYLRKISAQDGGCGFTTYRYDQMFNGLSVWGASIVCSVIPEGNIDVIDPNSKQKVGVKLRRASTRLVR